MAPKPPGADRAQLEESMAPIAGAAPEAPMPEEEELPELQARIVRLEDILIDRGVANESDFAPIDAPAGPDGAPLPPEAAAPQGAPVPPQV